MTQYKTSLRATKTPVLYQSLLDLDQIGLLLIHKFFLDQVGDRCEDVNQLRFDPNEWCLKNRLFLLQFCYFYLDSDFLVIFSIFLPWSSFPGHFMNIIILLDCPLIPTLCYQIMIRLEPLE